MQCRQLTTNWRGLLLWLAIASGSLMGASSGPAPDFTLPARDGTHIGLATLKGQVVMINFWASWCGPCRQEFPLLDELYRRYSPLGFTLLGINIESDLGDAERWLAETPVSFPVLFDRENAVSQLYEVNAMPSTVFIDRQGEVRYLHRGFKPGDENEYLNVIRGLLKE